MLKMFQVNYIRDLHNSGCRISKISDETALVKLFWTLKHKN